MAARLTGRTRAKDSDRDATCRQLDEAHSEGQLSMAEHQQRIARALQASTLGELADLVADLQRNASSWPRPAKKSVPRAQILTAAGAAVVGFGIIGAIVFSGGDDVTPATPSANPTPEVLVPPAVTAGPAPVDEPPPLVLNVPRYLNTVEGMSGVLEEMRKRFGSTMGFELTFTPDRADLSVPDPADDGRELSYTFRGGWDAPRPWPRSDSNQVTDLAAFDVPAAAAAWQAAPETLGITLDSVEYTYLDIAGSDSGPGPLELLIRVSTYANTYGYIYLDPAGNVLRVEKPS
ncbi:DUF1707 SHOCT-like domain-containing protein [Mycobacterium sp. C31M]